MRRYELIRVHWIESLHKLLHFSKWFDCVVLWLLTVSFVFPYIILCVINHRRARNKLSRSYKKEMSSWGLGIGALLKWLDSWKTFPSGLNICGKGRLLYFNGHQQDQSMLLLHFLLFRLKDEANFEKKKTKKKSYCHSVTEPVRPNSSSFTRVRLTCGTAEARKFFVNTGDRMTLLLRNVSLRFPRENDTKIRNGKGEQGNREREKLVPAASQIRRVLDL